MAAVDVDQALARDRGADERLAAALDGEAEVLRPGDGEVAVHLELVPVEVHGDELARGNRRLERNHARALEAEVEQALVARGHGARTLDHDRAVADVGRAGHEQAVVDHHGPAHVCLRAHEQDVAVGGLADDGAGAHVLRLDCRLAGNRAADGLAEEVAHALDARRCLDAACGPLHGAGLQRHAHAAVELADELTPAHAHLSGKVRGDGAAVGHREVALPLGDPEGALLGDDLGVVVVEEVVDAHGGPPWSGWVRQACGIGAGGRASFRRVARAGRAARSRL